jgi:hypothetical protein
MSLRTTALWWPRNSFADAHTCTPVHLEPLQQNARSLDTTRASGRGHTWKWTSTSERQKATGSYADTGAAFSHTFFEWAHSLSDVFTALTSAGLAIGEFREYPYSPFGCYPFLHETAPGRCTVRGCPVDVPLVFSVHATK